MQLGSPIEDIIASAAVGCPYTEAAVRILVTVSEEMGVEPVEWARARLPAWVGKQQRIMADAACGLYVRTTRIKVPRRSGREPNSIPIDPPLISWAAGAVRGANNKYLFRFNLAHLITATIGNDKRYKTFVGYVSEICESALLLPGSARHVNRRDAKCIACTNIIRFASKISGCEDAMRLPFWPTIDSCRNFNASRKHYSPGSIAITRQSAAIVLRGESGCSVLVVEPEITANGPTLIPKKLDAGRVETYFDFWLPFPLQNTARMP
ncbi:MAG: hypothetical protein QXP01_02370 [Candidatus Hadarchaeum sp.]